LVDWVVGAAQGLAPDPFVVVTSPESVAALEGTLPDGVALAVQEEPRGTGDAAAAARGALEGFEGDVLVLAGDAPLLTEHVLAALVDEHRRAAAAVTVLSFEPEDPGDYGRVLRDGEGRLLAIVEARDATREELALREVNSSIYVFAAADLWRALGRLEAHNAQGELYLTEAVRHLVDDGRPAAVYRASDPSAGEGVNTRADLAAAGAQLRDRIVARHLEAGVTIVDPATTWIEPEVEIEPDAVVHPFTVLRGKTLVRAGAQVGPHVVAVDAEIGREAVVGPFCYLRAGTVLESGAKAGAFVEVKNSRIGEGTKVPHLSYLGDAEVGAGSNIGAGTITANFPHEPDRPKGRTTIGRNVRTGIHNGLEAP
ncbi:MAG: bifunctional UDP-N-acetylglucosamine diphosphorylase/glucosamine-1-phosphate N-acetyltransferase GlmU, partial [Gaiellaceae bacterium]